jgi:hypothetical protein
MEITATLLFEGNAERLDLKSAAGIYVANDRPKTRDEQNSDFFQSLHCISSSRTQSGCGNGHACNEFSSRHTSNDDSEKGTSS